MQTLNTMTTQQTVTATETEDGDEALRDCRETLQAERRHYADAAFDFVDHTMQVEQMAEDCYRALTMLLTRLYEYKRSALYIPPKEYKQALAVLAKYKVQRPIIDTVAATGDKTEDELAHGWNDEAYD